MKNDALNPSRLVTLITRSPEFQAAMPRPDTDLFSVPELRQSRRRAVAKGAAGVALRLERERGAYDLDANLTAMIAQLDDFFFSSCRIEKLREHSTTGSYRGTSEAMQRQLRSDAQKVSAFNGTLREIINVGGNKFNFNELLAFMTNQHIAIGGHDTQDSFHELARTHLVGARDECAVEQVLTVSGIDFERGTAEQDAVGGDFIVDGVPLDFKSSPAATAKGKESARRHGTNPDRVVWSHIKPEHYQGGLVLPSGLNKSVADQLLPDIYRALESTPQSERYLA
jgi:hypothetical protein